jgi:hypothetical protein
MTWFACNSPTFHGDTTFTSSNFPLRLTKQLETPCTTFDNTPEALKRRPSVQEASTCHVHNKKEIQSNQRLKGATKGITDPDPSVKAVRLKVH